MMTIGRIAQKTGAETKTLRYYDRVGLLRPVTRTQAGYRLYNDDAVARLQFIRRAKTLGMTLADIRRILAFRDEGAVPCHHVLELVTRNIAQVESQVAQLRTLRTDLQRVVRELKRRIPKGAQATEDCPCFEIIAAFKAGKRNSNGRR